MNEEEIDKIKKASRDKKNGLELHILAKQFDWNARYAGNDATDEMNNHKLVTELRKKAHLPNYRNAYFYCCMVFVENSRDPTPLVATGKWCGNIIDEPRGNNGCRANVNGPPRQGRTPHCSWRGPRVARDEDSGIAVSLPRGDLV